MKKIKVICEMEVTLKIIGGKYKPLIINFLIQNGTKRFHEILNYLPSISQKTLTKQLKELEQEGLISRTLYPQVPPKVEYAITEKGNSLQPLLESMCEWGERNLSDRYELIHPQCNEKSVCASK